MGEVSNETRISEHVDESIALKIFEEFNQSHARASLSDLVAFAYKKGREDYISELAKERNSGSSLDALADNRSKSC